MNDGWGIKSGDVEQDRNSSIGRGLLRTIGKIKAITTYRLCFAVEAMREGEKALRRTRFES
jgi:hypothetical protein